MESFGQKSSLLLSGRLTSVFEIQSVTPPVIRKTTEDMRAMFYNSNVIS